MKALCGLAALICYAGMLLTAYRADWTGLIACSLLVLLIAVLRDALTPEP